MSSIWQQRISAMTPMQQGILSRIYNRITLCEGKGMPKTYWCDSCVSSMARVKDLFTRFEHINAAHILLTITTTTTHPGFEEFGP